MTARELIAPSFARMSALLVLLVGGCTGTARTPCDLVAMRAKTADMRSLYQKVQAPLVTVGDAVYACSCERRDQRGGDEARRHGGNDEARRHGGNEEGRRIGGSNEGRKVGGNDERRSLGGSEEGRRIGGSDEQRRYGGGDEERRSGNLSEGVFCYVAPGCGGFRISGLAAARAGRVFEGRRSVQLRGNCFE